MRRYGMILAASALALCGQPALAQSAAPATLLPIAARDGQILLTLPAPAADGPMGRYL